MLNQSVPTVTQTPLPTPKTAQATGVARLADLDAKLSQLHKKPGAHQQPTPAKVLPSGQSHHQQTPQPSVLMPGQTASTPGLPSAMPYLSQVSQTGQSHLLQPEFHPIHDRKASMDIQSLPINSYLPRPASEPVPDMPVVTMPPPAQVKTPATAVAPQPNTPGVDVQQDPFLKANQEKVEDRQMQTEQPARPLSPKPVVSPTKKSRFTVSAVPTEEKQTEKATESTELPASEAAEASQSVEKSSIDVDAKEGKEPVPAQPEQKKGRFTVARAPSPVKDMGAAGSADKAPASQAASQAQDVKDVISDLVTRTERNVSGDATGLSEQKPPSAPAPTKMVGRFHVDKVADVVQADNAEVKPPTPQVSLEEDVFEPVNDAEVSTKSAPERYVEEIDQSQPQSAALSLASKEAERDSLVQKIVEVQPVIPAIRSERKNSLRDSDRGTPDSIASDVSSLPPLPPDGPTLPPCDVVGGLPVDLTAHSEVHSTPPLSDVGSASPAPIMSVSIGIIIVSFTRQLLPRPMIVKNNLHERQKKHHFLEQHSIKSTALALIMPMDSFGIYGENKN